MRIAAAAFLYFLAVYAAGFLFGTVRVLLLEPRMGPFAAVLCEAPFLFQRKHVRHYPAFRSLRG
jgi:hypothetical protein